MTLRERIDRIKRQKAEAELQELYQSFIGRFIVLNGPKNSGKTLSGVHLAYQLREMTGRPVVIVSTSMGLKESFGPHIFLTLRDFICQMRMLNKAAPGYDPDWTDVDTEIFLLNQRGCPDREHDPDYVLTGNNQWRRRDACSEKALENIQDEGRECWSASHGIVLFNAIVLADEAKELFGGVYASNPVNRLVQGFVQRMRHLGITLIVMSPFRADIGPAQRGQVDTYGQCSTFTIRGRDPYTKVEFADGIMRINSGLRIPTLRYGEMYKSGNLLTIRDAHLNIAARQI